MESSKKVEVLNQWNNKKNKKNLKMPKEVYGFAIDLAHENNMDAFDIFEKGLEDEHELWREHCLRQIGYHYFPLEERIINKIKHILLNDASPFLRLCASSVLSSQINNPDKIFLKAIKKDSDIDVQLNCLKEYLLLCKVDQKTINQEMKNIEEDQIKLTRRFIKKLLNKYNLNN